MMKQFKEMKSGEKFKALGVTYEFVRYAGTCTTLNRNQWGRATGGSHTGDKIAVRVDRRHRGWSGVHYVAFPQNISVKVIDSDPSN